MTDLRRLAELQENCSKGPWEQGPPHNADTLNDANGRRIATGMCNPQDEIDFAFMAAARNFPFTTLVAELERLERENSELRAVMQVDNGILKPGM